MRHLVHEHRLHAEVEVDSAGTAGWHVGDPPDPRGVSAAAALGIRVSHRGRQFTVRDLDEFDLVLVMDDDNWSSVMGLARSPAHAEKVRYLRRYDVAANGDTVIDDPYYGGEAEFERCLREILASCRGLLESLRREHGWAP